MNSLKNIKTRLSNLNNNRLSSFSQLTLVNNTEYLSLRSLFVDGLSQDPCLDYITHCEEKVFLFGKKVNVTYKGPKNRKKNYVDPFHTFVISGKKGISSEYGYMEGFIVHKESGYVLPYSWNVDSNGNHVDFGYRVCETDEWEYYGVELSFNQLNDVCLKHGGVWGPILPFLEIKDKDKVRFQRFLGGKLVTQKMFGVRLIDEEESNRINNQYSKGVQS
jgi:hypothetical protein